MTLIGKETTMRRGVCILALLGMTVQTAVGAEFFGAGRGKTAAAPVAAPSKVPVTPQKFTRSKSSEAPSAELRSYYKELFGSSLPEEPESPSQPLTSQSAGHAASQAASQSRSFTRKPTSPSTTLTSEPASPGRSFGREPAASVKVDTPKSPVVHAEFQDKSTPGVQKIQQVNAESVDARPFPGMRGNEAATPASSTSKTRSFSRTEASAPAAPSSASQETASQTSSSQASSSQASAGKSSPGGTVSFSRSASASPRRSTASRRSSISRLRGEMESANTSTIAAPSVTVEWRKQSDINVGQECNCQLIVKNGGQSVAKEIDVRAYFPTSVRLVDAKPMPTHSDSYLGWEIGELKVGEERTIEVTMIPLQRGDINTRADVRFSGTATGMFTVSEPMLEIQVEGPKQVLIGESAAQIVTVSNPGTGIASQVQIEAVLPPGLEHSRGQRLQMELGNLNPGESRTVRLALAASKGGEHHLTIQARAESGLVRSADSNVKVIAPSLATAIQGPGLRYLGRQASYEMNVSNDGAAATDNVQLRYKMPSGFDFVTANRGAQFDPATGLVTWFVGRLEPGQKSEIKVTLLARQSGEFKHLVRATSEHGAIADAEFSTVIEGTPSLAVRVKDLEDPVEVGSEMAYEIRVSNEGSAPAKAVGLSCEMAEGMSFVNAEGPGEFRNEGHTVMFRPLAEVGAGQTAIFRVKVKAAAPGSLRFRAHLSSESVAEPLTAEELTKFYGERN